MEPKRIKRRVMPINLSIKNVPEEWAERLRRRAALAHRSLQGELMKILEEAVADEPAATPAEILAEVRALGLKSRDEATEMIREDRDARSGR